MQASATRGHRNGGIPPIGYKAIKKKDGTEERTIIIPDEKYAPVVKRIFSMYENGDGLKEIAKKLNGEGIETNRKRPWSSTTIYQVLTNETYLGTLVWGSTYTVEGKKLVADPEDVIRVENCHPAIISPDVFERVQKNLKERSPKQMHPRRVNSNYLLTGLIFCGRCDHAMVGRSAKKGKYSYYTCGGQCKKGKIDCNAIAIPKEQIEDFVLERLQENVLTNENIDELVALVKKELLEGKKSTEDQIDEVNKQMAGVNERLERLYEAAETGSFNEVLAARISERVAEKNDLEKRRAELTSSQAELVGVVDEDIIKREARKLKKVLQTGTLSERKSFIRSFVKRIEVDMPQITIEYSIPTKSSTVGNVARAESLRIVESGPPFCLALHFTVIPAS